MPLIFFKIAKMEVIVRHLPFLKLVYYLNYKPVSVIFFRVYGSAFSWLQSYRLGYNYTQKWLGE